MLTRPLTIAIGVPLLLALAVVAILALTAPPSPAGGIPEDYDELNLTTFARAMDFSACMRAQGLEFPDPIREEQGFSGPAGPMDGDWDAFNAAAAVCIPRD